MFNSKTIRALICLIRLICVLLNGNTDFFIKTKRISLAHALYGNLFNEIHRIHSSSSQKSLFQRAIEPIPLVTADKIIT